MEISTTSRTSPPPSVQQTLQQNRPTPTAPATASPMPPIDSVEISAQAARERGLAKNGMIPQSQVWDRGPSGLLYEKDKPNATVAVLDTFGLSMIPGGAGIGPAHGEVTSAIAVQSAGGNEEAILRVEVAGQASPLTAPSPKEPSQQLDHMITNIYTSFADKTSEALKEIHSTRPSITTVSHSAGINAPQLSEDLWMMAHEQPEFASFLGKALGLPSDTDWSKPESALAIAERVQKTLANSSEVAASTERLEETLEGLEGKVRYFNSAGNGGQFQQMLSGQGFSFDAKWSGNGQNQSDLTETIASGIPCVSTKAPEKLQACSAPYSQQTVADAAAPGGVLVTMDGIPMPSQILDPDGPNGPAKPVPIFLHTGTSNAVAVAAGLHGLNPKQYETLKANALEPVADNLGTGLLVTP